MFTEASKYARYGIMGYVVIFFRLCNAIKLKDKFHGAAVFSAESISGFLAGNFL
jgi:hypothetical protein